MAISTIIKDSLNARLRRFNLRVDSLSTQRIEAARVEDLSRRGHFDGPAFPVPACFQNAQSDWVLREVGKHVERFRDLCDADRNPVGYSFANNYFSSPDAEVLYSLVRALRPARIIEIGCGNSTKLSRLALMDEKADGKLICIDPNPRTDVASLADELFRERVELVDRSLLIDKLRAGDFLFIDSSHIVKTGNDVVHLYSNVLPFVPAGVVVHIHDVFLPYDYPLDWITTAALDFGEQYLVQVMLQSSRCFEVLWPGYHVQRSRSDFSRHFEHLDGRRAQSLWLRTTAAR
jgi:hypothetical protein